MFQAAAEAAAAAKVEEQRKLAEAAAELAATAQAELEAAQKEMAERAAADAKRAAEAASEDVIPTEDVEVVIGGDREEEVKIKIC